MKDLEKRLEKIESRVSNEGEAGQWLEGELGAWIRGGSSDASALNAAIARVRTVNERTPSRYLAHVLDLGLLLLELNESASQAA